MIKTHIIFIFKKIILFLNKKQKTTINSFNQIFNFKFILFQLK
jgi:hypothetical protein